MAQHTVANDEVCIYPSGKDLLSPFENLLHKDQYTLIEQSHYYNRAVTLL